MKSIRGPQTRPTDWGRHARGLLGASSADGLYRRLAGFSGAPSRLVPAWWAEELAERFVTELGVAGNPDKLIDLEVAAPARHRRA